MLEEIQAAQKAHDEKEALRQIQELKRELGLKLKNNKSPKIKKANAPRGAGVNLNSLKLGAEVMINDLGDKGSVLSINKKDGTAVIQVGIMKITAKADNSTLVAEEEERNLNAIKKLQPMAATSRGLESNPR